MKMEVKKRLARIAELEKQIARIENNPDNVVGGVIAFMSGAKTTLKAAPQKKLKALNKELDKLLDQAEA